MNDNEEKNKALIIVDVQNDFLPGGALGIKNSDLILPVINALIREFEKNNNPIFYSRDWHPQKHSSFELWPPHCIQNTWGAEFSPKLYISKNAQIISKATKVEKDAYSAFNGTTLHNALQNQKIEKLTIVGLATDYCVCETVIDACKLGYQVEVIKNGIAAVNVNTDDGKKATERMLQAGAIIKKADLSLE